MVKDHFLAQKVYAKFAHDIRFDGTGTKIDAVRIPVLTRYVILLYYWVLYLVLGILYLSVTSTSTTNPMPCISSDV